MFLDPHLTGKEYIVVEREFFPKLNLVFFKNLFRGVMSWNNGLGMDVYYVYVDENILKNKILDLKNTSLIFQSPLWW
jgi:hypothetical protein